ncbi:cold-shock protein [Actinosynnema sp. NPDC020468]|uniref:cold-shock protein n=1 Tax=Actinosynnema sp. NPDC020468 TaxID=3154488 RepID=UPI0033C63A84
MTQGTIKWFNGTKGFGFISPEGGGADLFVHHSEVQGYEANALADGRRVEYEVGQGDKGPHAVGVNLR